MKFGLKKFISLTLSGFLLIGASVFSGMGVKQVEAEEGNTEISSEVYQDSEIYPDAVVQVPVLAVREDKKMILDLSSIEDYDTKIIDHRIYYTWDDSYSPTYIEFDGPKVEFSFAHNMFFEDLNSNYHCFYQETPTRVVRMNFEFTSMEGPLSVAYSAHMQGIGWQEYCENGVAAGDTTDSRRLEAIKIKTAGNVNLGVEYTAYCESTGWLDWVSDDTICGTEGQGKRLEAIKIRLNGYDADRRNLYDIYYRVKCEGLDWLGWAKNGESAGTIGYSKKIEALQIIISEKGKNNPGDVDGIISSYTEAFMQQEEQDFGDVLIDEKNFPDPSFRRIVKSKADKNYDDVLSVDEARSLTNLSVAYYVGGEGLYSLKGIEFFGSLKGLYCGGYNIEELDLSHNTELEELDCQNNCLTELDLQANKKLTVVNCSKNTIKNLVIGENESLKKLFCRDNQIESLDLEGARSLELLSCGRNPISALKVNNNLKSLEYSETNNKEINPADYPELEALDCSGNGLTVLDLSANGKLTRLSCENNNLTDIKLPKEMKLGNLSVDWDNMEIFQLDEIENVQVYRVVPSVMTENGYEVDFSWLNNWTTNIEKITYSTVEGNSKKDHRIYGSEIAERVKNGILMLPINTKKDSLYCDYKYSDTKTIHIYMNIDIKETEEVKVIYRTHVQGIGWQSPVSDGKVAGTSGQAKRIEAIKINLETEEDINIQYTTYCQNYGWLPWSLNGELSGTEGESKRLEAIRIKLTGKDAYKYDIFYRVHAQNYGWLLWACNGETSGTLGVSKRLEAIQIVVVKKGEQVPNSLEGIKSNSNYVSADERPSWDKAKPISSETVNVAVRTHVQTYGWQGWRYNGKMAGTSGESKRLEGINIKLTNQLYDGGIEYRTHVQNYGWMDWKKNGEMSGTSGESKRLEAIQIRLTGKMAEKYDVYYRVHSQKFGWLGWAKNGEMAGTAGY